MPLHAARTLAVALVLACLSFTPSLLPRPASFQGLSSGSTPRSVTGSGCWGLAWREFADRPARRPERRSWTILGAVAGVALVVSMLLGIRWQRRGSAMVDVEPETRPRHAAGAPVIAVLVFVALVALARAVRTGYRRLAALLERHMGHRAARASGLVVLVVLGSTLATRSALGRVHAARPTAPSRSWTP